jgi:hypothetical protein
MSYGLLMAVVLSLQMMVQLLGLAYPCVGCRRTAERL